MNVYRDMGLLTLRIGKLYISNGWTCKRAWRTYYGNKRPWRKWSRNPIFKKLTDESGETVTVVLLGFIFTRRR